MKKNTKIALTILLSFFLSLYMSLLIVDFTGWRYDCEIIYTYDSMLTFSFTMRNNRLKNQTIYDTDFKLTYEDNGKTVVVYNFTINSKNELHFSSRQEHTFLLKTPWPQSTNELELYFFNEELVVEKPISWGMGDLLYPY